MSDRFDAELIGKKRDQAGIGLAIDRWRRKADFQRFAVEARYFGFLRPRLDVQPQRHSLVVGKHPAHCNRIIGITLLRRLATCLSR